MSAARRTKSVAAELKVLLLAEPRLTLAVAESLTAGNVQAQTCWRALARFKATA